MRPVHQKNGQQSIGRSRGGLSTKIHAAVDGLGHLARFRLTVGQHHDITEAENLMEGMQNLGAVIADKAFDATSLLTRIAAMKATAVIPPKANRNAFRSHDKHVYKSQNLIERFAPHTPAIQMTGLLIAWAASIGGGALFYAQIEYRAQRLLAKK